jgi:hypothetical protein
MRSCRQKFDAAPSGDWQDHRCSLSNKSPILKGEVSKIQRGAKHHFRELFTEAIPDYRFPHWISHLGCGFFQSLTGSLTAIIIYDWEILFNGGMS